MKSITAVVEQADFILAQCAALIDGVPADAFARDSQRVRGGTIGKHVRHTLDHYRSLLDGFDSATTVDYDHRERGVAIESDQDAAKQAVAMIRSRIGNLDEKALRGDVRIRVMLAGDGAETELDTTLGRELAFASHHAIHHNALIKAIALEFGVKTPPEFGMAPSTLNFQGQA